MFITAPDHERGGPFMRALMLEMDRKVEVAPNFWITYCDDRGRIAIDAPHEVKVHRVPRPDT
jgi:hypothetical protein